MSRAYNYYSSRSREEDPLRDIKTGALKSFVDPEKYEKISKQEKIDEASRDIERYKKEIEEKQIKIIEKEAIIKKNKEEEEKSKTPFKIGNFYVSTIMIPTFISLALSLMTIYDLSGYKSELGSLYNTVYQPLITLIAANFILLLTMMFVLSQKYNPKHDKSVKMGTIILSSGLIIVLTSSAIDKIGKTYKFTNGNTISASQWVSSKWLYWNIVFQVLIIIGVLFLNEKIDFLLV